MSDRRRRKGPQQPRSKSNEKGKNRNKHSFDDDPSTSSGRGRSDKEQSRNTRRQYQQMTRRRNEHNLRQRRQKSSQATHAENCDSEPSVSEIPGFYYDKEKKKYFKILPNHNSGASGSITHEVIRNRVVEKKRQEDLEEIFKPRTCSFELTGNKPTCLRSSNCYHLVTACSVGLRSPSSTASSFRKYFAQRLVPRAKVDVVQQAREDFAFDLDNLEDAKRLIVSPDATCLVGVWSLKQFIRERLQMIHIEPVRRSASEDSVILRTKGHDRVHAFDIQKVTGMCWAPRSQETDHTSRVLFTTTSFLGDGTNMARIIDLNSTSNPTGNDYFDIGPSAAWSCAWSAKMNQFCVGTENCTLWMDVATRRLWELYSGNTAVYALTISKKTGQVMYSGTRKGVIYTHDLRSKSTRPVSAIAHKKGIAHLYLSNDETSLIASDVVGRIKKWDIRQRKVVHEYPGHVNQYVRQPFNVDQSENMLFAAGQDCYTRVWCYRTGSLLHTLPPPNPVSIDSIPLISYSESMGGRGGLPGLLMASKGEFHFYSF